MTSHTPPDKATSDSRAEPMPPPKGRGTLAVRGGEPERHAYDAVVAPIACTATYTFKDSQAIADHFEGRVDREEYGRYGNPTVALAETRLAALEGTEAAVVFPSGMSAITTALLAMLKPGDHIVLTNDCYRRTRQFVIQTLGKFGILHTFVAPDNLEEIDSALSKERTRLLISEAPTNPYLRVVDVAALAKRCRTRRPRVKFMIDATLASPHNLRPAELGVDLVVHSCSKYLGGHNDLLAGVICGNSSLVEAFRDARGLFGGILDAHSAYLLVRGLKTLPLRMRQHNENGQRVAQFLEGHPDVEKVFYPGLPSHPDHAVAKRLMHGYGGVVSFLVKGDLERTSRFIDACTLPSIGPSMGGAESLIEQPALMSFFELTTEQRLAVGIRNNLVRFSTGLEDAEDLIADVERALANSR